MLDDIDKQNYIRYVVKSQSGGSAGFHFQVSPTGILHRLMARLNSMLDPLLAESG